MEDVSNSSIDNKKIIIIAGKEVGTLDGVDLPPLKAENMSTDAAVGLVQAVYTGAVKELSDIYACDSGYRSADPTPLEKFFTQNRFGIVDGDMVIKECKKRADEKRRKRYEQSGAQTAGKKSVNR